MNVEVDFCSSCPELVVLQVVVASKPGKRGPTRNFWRVSKRLCVASVSAATDY